MSGIRIVHAAHAGQLAEKSEPGFLRELIQRQIAKFAKKSDK